MSENWSQTGPTGRVLRGVALDQFMQKGVREDGTGAGIRGSNMPSGKILRQARALGSQRKLKPMCLESKGGEKQWKMQLKGGAKPCWVGCPNPTVVLL